MSDSSTDHSADPETQARRLRASLAGADRPWGASLEAFSSCADRTAVFEAQRANPDAWVIHARRLKLVADAIGELVSRDLEKLVAAPAPGGVIEAPYSMLGPEYLLLAGLAIENLLKGIQIKRHGEHAKYETHNLRQLLSGTGIALSDAENLMVDRLTAFVTWAGRYPIPRRSSDMELTRGTFGDDPETFRQLFARLEERAKTAGTS